MIRWDDIDSTDPFLHEIRTRVLRMKARGDQQKAERHEFATASAEATVCDPDAVSPDWNARYTLVAQRGHGGYTLYQDRDGCWFRVNTEALP